MLAILILAFYMVRRPFPNEKTSRVPSWSPDHEPFIVSILRIADAMCLTFTSNFFILRLTELATLNCFVRDNANYGQSLFNKHDDF